LLRISGKPLNPNDATGSVYFINSDGNKKKGTGAMEMENAILLTDLFVGLGNVLLFLATAVLARVTYLVVKAERTPDHGTPGHPAITPEDHPDDALAGDLPADATD
jgi:hypothetical protein